MDSNEAMHRLMPTSQAAADRGPDDLVHTIALLFRVFARAFGTKWRATFEDPQAPAVWERKLRASGLSPEAVRAGMGPATNLAFPPSLGEFIGLCKPPAPLLDAALREAMAWHPDTEHAWTHPAIGATAREVGYWRLHSQDDRQVRALFDSIYRQMLDRHARGEGLDQPAVRALESPTEKRTTTPRGAPVPESVAQAIAEAARLLGDPNG